MAPSRSQRCPGETNSGLTRSRVRRTAPIVSSPSVKALHWPRVGPGSSYSPKRCDLAQPIVGISSQSPRWDARPSRRGCAIPCPSQIKHVGADRELLERLDHRRCLAEAQQARHIRERGLGDHARAIDQLQGVGAEHDHRRVERRAPLVVRDIGARRRSRYGPRGRSDDHPLGQLALRARRPPPGRAPSDGSAAPVRRPFHPRFLCLAVSIGRPGAQQP